MQAWQRQHLNHSCYCSPVLDCQKALRQYSLQSTKLLTLQFRIQTTLMPEMQNLNFLTGKAFVRQSATTFPVLMYSKMTSLRYTRSLAKWCMMSMCLLLTEAMACFNSVYGRGLSESQVLVNAIRRHGWLVSNGGYTAAGTLQLCS